MKTLILLLLVAGVAVGAFVLLKRRRTSADQDPTSLQANRRAQPLQTRDDFMKDKLIAVGVSALPLVQQRRHPHHQRRERRRPKRRRQRRGEFQRMKFLENFRFLTDWPVSRSAIGSGDGSTDAVKSAAINLVIWAVGAWLVWKIVIRKS